MTEWLHPALLMLLGAALLPLTRSTAQKALSLAVPLLVLYAVSQMAPGTSGEITFAGVELALFQADGLSLVFAWVFATSLALWFVIKQVMGIRISEEEEYLGMDASDCGIDAYPEFVTVKTS